MDKIRTNVGGIDIGAKKVFTSFEGHPVVSHFTFTEDFLLLRKFLLENHIESVAMEVIGVYWVILHKILEDAGQAAWLLLKQFFVVKGTSSPLCVCATKAC